MSDDINEQVIKHGTWQNLQKLKTVKRNSELITSAWNRYTDQYSLLVIYLLPMYLNSKWVMTPYQQPVCICVKCKILTPFYAHFCYNNIYIYFISTHYYTGIALDRVQ